MIRFWSPERGLLVLAWAVAIAVASGTAQPLGAAVPPPVQEMAGFDIQDAGRKRSFELALDELAEKSAWGDARIAVLPGAGVRRNLGDLQTIAREREVTTGVSQDIVLYEKGTPRDENHLRVLTRKIVVRNDPGFDNQAAAARIDAVKTETPTYAPDHVIFTVKGPGDALIAVEALRALVGVVSAEPLLARRHGKRLIPNDTYFSYNATHPGYQWHLRNTGQSPGTSGADANVTPVWDSFTGTGVRVGIVDDGLEVAHPDLSPNVDAVNDHDWNDSTPNDPTGNASSDTHGTACAGVAAARGNNGAGTSGSAPNATLVGLRLISGNVSDAEEAEALSWKNDIIQVYSNSWGPADDGADLRDAGVLVKAALATGAASGRGGKGSIWLWAAGNGGDVGDNSNYDGYANSIHTIAIGAVNDTGVRSDYSEPGANVVVCAPSNDTVGSHRGITTTTTNSGYTHSFGGTSSATPLAAGVVALMLQSNPNLGWRDVQEILLRSATKVNPAHSDWILNGAGFSVNHEYGGGRINAQAAVNMAVGWANLGPQTTHQISQTGLAVSIPDGSATGVTRTFNVPGTVLMRVEHATLHVTATHGRRGDLGITLTSPSGTPSKLFVSHSGDSNLNLDWTFSSVRHWGESAAGNWTVNITDQTIGTEGSLTEATLTLYGTNATPPTAPPTISSPLAASGNAGSPFSYQISATQNPQTFSAAGLPAGLTLGSNGLIRGTPATAGSYPVNIGATNLLGTGQATLVITVGARLPTPPVITSSLTATAVRNVVFNYQITATNSPTSFTSTGLPTGLALNPGSGSISGVPTVSGSFPVSISAGNADGTDTRSLAITVTSTASLLAQALDAPQLVFTTGGDVPWVVPAASTHDGIDAAESGDITDNQQSWLETTVEGPVFVKFWFQLDSESGFDFFRFSIDGEELWYSEGYHAWRLLGFHVPAGIHTLRWNYTKDDSTSTGADRLQVDQIEVQGVQQLLGDALDNPDLTWQMPGGQAWVLQNRRTTDATDAMISPIFLDHGRNSVIETPVTGPGTVSFWWTVSSEENADFFRFEIDGSVMTQISGNSSGDNIPWVQQTITVPSGQHMLRWRYIKNETGSAGLDACWLDQVTYTTSFATGPPYAKWLNSAFPTAKLGNALNTGPDVDYDGDGRSNLHEYAFGGSPVVPDFANALVPTTSGNDVVFSYSTDDSKTDLSITPQLSGNLGTWLVATPEFVSQSGGRTTWRVRSPKSEGKKFMHLRADLTQ